ncbi:glucan biosynthesis protein [Halovulum sp. GXIMD14794]
MDGPRSWSLGLLSGMSRRGFLVSSVAALAVGQVRAQEVATEPSLLEMAMQLRDRPYVPPSGELPPPFAGLDYNAFRAIRTMRGHSSFLPLGDDYAYDLLPPGLYFPDPVTVEAPDAEGFAPVPFSPRLFEFDARYFTSVPQEAPGAGFSGLRVRHPLNDSTVMDEFLVVQGGSYFRAIGRAMVYGLSARAVALGTGGPTPEEFPRFTQLRLLKPREGRARLEAVIDSASLTGHMSLEAEPGDETRLSVTVTLFPRREIADVGIAALTSMYLKGPLRNAVSDDFRPAVHDTDVLVIENGAGETLWRPLSNPARVETSAFGDVNPRGFGLYQTDRDFGDFEDAEARYHDRPSARVEPHGDWGAGAVILVEIPTGDEFMDNMVAFWRPEAVLAAGSEHAFSYDIVWTRQPPAQPGPAQIIGARAGRVHDRPGALRYVVDFDHHPEESVADLTASNGAEIDGVASVALPDGRHRVTFVLLPNDADAAELRLVLRTAEGMPASAVWLHRWTPARDGGV